MICIVTAKTPLGPMAVMAAHENIEKVASQCVDLSFEHEVTSYLRSTQPSMFIDVGAAWGYHSMVMHRTGAEVVAIEPEPIRAGVCRWNAHGRFEVHEVAIGFREVHLPKLAGKMVRADSDGRPARTIPLDLLMVPDARPTTIKVDVEGLELEVLASADAWLARDNVCWCVECHGDANGGLGETMDAVDILFRTQAIPPTGLANVI